MELNIYMYMNNWIINWILIYEFFSPNKVNDKGADIYMDTYLENVKVINRKLWIY